MKLLSLKPWTELEKDLLRKNRSRVNIGLLLLYLGAAAAITLLMGWGFGWPQINEPTYIDPPDHYSD